MTPSEILAEMKPVAETFERLYAEGGDLAGWIAYVLENLDDRMDRPEFEAELRKLKMLLDERLQSGRW